MAKLRRSRSLYTIGSIALLAVLAFTFWPSSSSQGHVENGEALTHLIVRSDFMSTIVEPGDLGSSSNIEVRCRIKNGGRSGTTILKIVSEGTFVKKDEFVVQFDDSALQKELIEQSIRVARDEASVIQAESDVLTSERVLDEYENGTFEQNLAQYETVVAYAEENFRRTEEFLSHSRRLSAHGYITAPQLKANEFAVIKAGKELDLAKKKLKVFGEFTKRRMIGTYEASVKKLKAELKAKKNTLRLSQKRAEEIEKEIEKCIVLAPADGMVVYGAANSRNRSSIVIEEGSTIRDGQVILRLPDPQKMQVVTKVNDSKINDVKVGQLATIMLDTDPENPVEGVVREVANFPLPRRWHQAPIEFEVMVEVTRQTEAVKPGLRAKVAIRVAEAPQSLQAPVSSLIKEQDDYYVIVQTPVGPQAQRVTVGCNNDQFVVIETGLFVGDRVFLNGEKYRDKIQFTSKKSG